MNTKDNIIDLTDFQWPKGPNADTYTPEQRLIAAQAYVTTRSNREAAKVSGINHRTIEEWNSRSNAHQWWYELQKRIQIAKNQELDNKLSEVIDLCIDRIKVKLNDGAGSLRDITYTLSTAYEKRSLLRGEATEINTIAKVDMNEHLHRLKQEFEKIVNH